MLDNYRELIDELLEAPNAVRVAFERAPKPDHIVPIVSTMTEQDRLLAARLRFLIEHPDALLEDCPTPPPPPELGTEAAFDTARGDLVSLLINLTLKDWALTVRSVTGRETDLAEEVELHVDHCQALLTQLSAASEG